MQNMEKTTNYRRVIFPLDPSIDYRSFFGTMDRNIKLLEHSFFVKIKGNASELILEGEHQDVAKVKEILTELLRMQQAQRSIRYEDFRVAVRQISQGSRVKLGDFNEQAIILPRRTVKAKSRTQKDYIELMKEKDMVFSVGPAGTGKTYLAVAMAIFYIQEHLLDRIILTRPALEAGEKLGYLPGDMYQKVNPYLRPLYDALYELLGVEKVAKYTERGLIEIAPLAYMRGRTLNNCFIILDEAQNSTAEQMKMFLTRMGINSKAIITGDITQVDLPSNRESGLIQAIDLLADIEDIGIIRFGPRDVVRHSLVQKIIEAYERKKAKEKQS